MNLNFGMIILLLRCIAFIILSLFYASPENRCYVYFIFFSLFYAFLKNHCWRSFYDYRFIL